MAKQTINRHIYTTDAEGNSVFAETITFEIEVPTQEELVAEKEAQLLAMYEELKSLKGE